MSAPPTRLPRVKICGLRRPEDASLALELGADLLGCVFADDSPRCATIAEATAIRALADATPVVLVTRDLPPLDILQFAKVTGLERVQVHGGDEEIERVLASMGLTVHRVRAIAPGSTSLPELDPQPTEDAPALFDVARGGSGERFDWSLLKDTGTSPIYIAGGINPENIQDLLGFQPFGVDVSSGIESAPGEKDPDLMRLFFERLAPTQP